MPIYFYYSILTYHGEIPILAGKYLVIHAICQYNYLRLYNAWKMLTYLLLLHIYYCACGPSPVNFVEGAHLENGEERAGEGGKIDLSIFQKQVSKHLVLGK